MIEKTQYELLWNEKKTHKNEYSKNSSIDSSISPLKALSIVPNIDGPINMSVCNGH